MQLSVSFSIITIALLITGCAGSSQQATGRASQTQSSKSIIPDINEEGRRGEMARKMMAKSTSQFMEADMNQDSLISIEEAEQHLIFISKDFARYDKNKDSSISWQEFIGHDKWPAPLNSLTKP